MPLKLTEQECGISFLQPTKHVNMILVKVVVIVMVMVMATANKHAFEVDRAGAWQFFLATNQTW